MTIGSSDSFTGRTVLITGGGSGIGQAAALAFAQQGAAVAVTGRRHGPLADTVGRITDNGGEASAVAADVTDSGEIARVIQAVVQRHGGLDVAVNNAGINVTGQVADVTLEAWAQIVAVNLTGVWLCMKHEIAQLRQTGGGAIVNVSSVFGAHMTVPGAGPYAATKAGVSALTRAAAREYIGEGIRINAVSPGPVDTPMSCMPGETEADRARRVATAVPIERVGTVDEIAEAILWLASARAGFAVGHDLVIDGGVSV